MTPSLMAILGFAMWTLLLSVTIAMTRTVFVMRG